MCYFKKSKYPLQRPRFPESKSKIKVDPYNNWLSFPVASLVNTASRFSDFYRKVQRTKPTPRLHPSQKEFKQHTTYFKSIHFDPSTIIHISLKYVALHTTSSHLFPLHPTPSNLHPQHSQHPQHPQAFTKKREKKCKKRRGKCHTCIVYPPS